MTIDDLLDRPVEEAARRRALDLLEAAVAACGRIDDPADEEAMHDFRVALRRLRALMKLHKSVLGGRVSKLRRRVAEVAALTGEARDAEVQLAWLRARRTAAPRSARPAFDWLCGRLEERKRSGYTLARRSARAELERVAPKLRRRLARYEVDLEEQQETTTLAAALAERVRAEAAGLTEMLHVVTTATDEELAHRARIAGKQLRYLLEPLADSQRAGAEARAAVKGLKKLQDLLGELHDVHVFARIVDELTVEAGEARLKNGLTAIAGLVRGRRDDLFADLLQARERLPDVGALSARLRRGVEIERKYLLSALPQVADAQALEIEQGYLPGERFRERLRMTRSPDGKVSYARTVKLGAGSSRTELEAPCPEPLFRSLWPLTAGKRVRKRRMRVADGALVWDIDEVVGAGVVLAEVGLPTADTEVTPPEWLAPLIVREVTGEKELSNEALAS